MVLPKTAVKLMIDEIVWYAWGHWEPLLQQRTMHELITGSTERMIQF